MIINDQFRAVAILNPAYVSIHTSDGKFLFLNHYAKGFTEQDVIGSSVYEYLSPESRPALKKAFEECLISGKTVKFEHTAMGDNKEMRNYEDFCVSFIGESHEKVVMLISRDCTDRKIEEEKLRASIVNLEQMNRIMVDRELEMVKLKDKIKELEAKLQTTSSN